MRLSAFILLFQALFTIPASADMLYQEKGVERLLEAHKLISHGVLDLTQRLDSFFGREHVDMQRNDSHVRLRFTTALEEYEHEKYKLNLNTKLALPATQKRFHLVFQTFEESLFKQNETGQAEVHHQDSFKDSSTLAGLRHTLFESNNIHIHTGAGVKLEIPADPFVRMRARYVAPLGIYQLVLSEDLYWFDSTGVRSVTDANVHYSLTDNKLLTFGNQAAWSKDEALVLFTHGLSLTHQLSDRDSIVYWAGIYAVDRPVMHLISYDATVKYRRRLYEDWLFGEVQTTGTWARVNRFTFLPLASFRIEVFFGG